MFFFKGWTLGEDLQFIKICFQHKCFCPVMQPDGALWSGLGWGFQRGCLCLLRRSQLREKGADLRWMGASGRAACAVPWGD